MIEELKTFIQVAKYKNFTKASKIVNLSQPSVSSHIKKLENYFGVILIERSNKTKQVNVTKQGHILYEEGLLLIRQIENIQGLIARSEYEVSGKLKVGTSQTIGEHFLPVILKQLAMAYPNLEIEVIIENTTSICEKVKTRIVDIGLIEGKNIPYDFKREYILGDKMVLTVSNDSELLHTKNVIEALQEQVWITREEGSGTQEHLQLFLAHHGIVPKSMMVFGTNHAIKEAVKNGIGITLISEYVVEHAAYDQELAIVALEEQWIREFSYILSPEAEMNPAIEAFITLLKQMEHVVEKQGAQTISLVLPE